MRGTDVLTSILFFHFIWLHWSLLLLFFTFCYVIFFHFLRGKYVIESDVYSKFCWRCGWVYCVCGLPPRRGTVSPGAPRPHLAVGSQHCLWNVIRRLCEPCYCAVWTYHNHYQLLLFIIIIIIISIVIIVTMLIVYITIFISIIITTIIINGIAIVPVGRISSLLFHSYSEPREVPGNDVTHANLSYSHCSKRNVSYFYGKSER